MFEIFFIIKKIADKRVLYAEKAVQGIKFVFAY